MSTISLVPIRPDTSLDDAERIRRVDDPMDFTQAILTEGEFMAIRMPPRQYVLRNLIIERSITIINGWRGGGKSWFIDSIANEVSWGGGVGPWKVEKPMTTMIVDGEMPIELLKERLADMNKGRDIRHKPSELFLYPEAYAYRIGLKRANILDEVWRHNVSEAVSDLNIKFLALDNLSSLAPGIDENDKTMFDPVNRWLLELRFMGVTIVMTHHTGKTGEQRGTSAHEDHVDTALLLSKPKKYNHDEGCKFIMSATKDRAYLTGGATFTCELMNNKQGALEFAVSDVETGKATMVSLNPNMSRQEAKSMGISDRTYYRVKNSKPKA